MEGITTVKQHKPDYTELKPDTQVLKELSAKPRSWIGIAITKAKLIPTAQKTMLEDISERSQENNTTHLVGPKSGQDSMEISDHADRNIEKQSETEAKDASFFTAKEGQSAGQKSLQET